MNDSLINKMKQAGWTKRRNYFYKLIADKVLVIELRNDKYCLDVFSRENVERINRRQIFPSLNDAFFRASELEIGYLGK